MNLIIEKFPYLDSAGLFGEVANRPWAMFLDSGVVNAKRPVNKHADFDVLAINPCVTLVSEGNTTLIESSSGMQSNTNDPMQLLQEQIRSVLPQMSAQDYDSCPYIPGALGYFSYDLARRYETFENTATDDEQLPDMAIGIYTALMVVDHCSGVSKLIYLKNSEDAGRTAQQWRKLIAWYQGNRISDVRNNKKTVPADRIIRQNMERQDYQKRFQSVRDYTIAGDCYQVNLAKSFCVETDEDTWQIYQTLRESSPAPYAAYLNLPFAKVLSNSPESFIQCRNHVVTTSPIKGTAARDHTDLENDRKTAHQLQNSAKDRAENLMIVDLMRNDLGRCCELGSIQVPSLFALHSFANVHHLISTITGVLKEDLHALDLLRSCFPGGSITGAPKIRAMQIIEELEPHRRGLYCGCIAYIGCDGSLESNIAIRTIVIKDAVARFSAGGGLVIDSQLDQEYQEIVDKAKMLKQALCG